MLLGYWSVVGVCCWLLVSCCLVVVWVHEFFMNYDFGVWCTRYWYIGNWVYIDFDCVVLFIFNNQVVVIDVYICFIGLVNGGISARSVVVILVGVHR